MKSAHHDVVEMNAMGSILVVSLLPVIDSLRLFEYVVLNHVETGTSNFLKSFLSAYGEDALPEKLKTMLHARLCEIGVNSLRRVSESCRPDHVSSPPALAYAIRHCAIDRDGIAVVKYFLDHGEKLDEYISRADGLVGCVLNQLSTVRLIKLEERKPTEDCGTECFTCC